MSLFRKLRDTFRPHRVEEQIGDKFQSHMEQRIADLMARGASAELARGASAELARREAARMFCNRAALSSASCSTWSPPSIRQAWRRQSCCLR
jgi:hypothetical protein